VACTNNLVQLIIAVQNYEAAHRLYPSGTIEPAGPIQNVAEGYHHGWITRLLPYLEQRAAYHHIDRSVGVYHPNNVPVRDLNISGLACPSTRLSGPGYSSYAAVHHDVEQPIDVDNHGVFFLNSKVRYLDISDGSSQTLFLGEKLTITGDLGWMSGTRATLRNTGTVINEVHVMRELWGAQRGPPSQEGMGFEAAGAVGLDMAESEPAGGTKADFAADARNRASAAAQLAEPPVLPPIVDGKPTAPTAVGGFESEHPDGANFAFGDGSVRFLGATIDAQVFQQLGHRADGELLDQDF
jgi:prepilin-type processing-associated H-X9-DG protein